MTVQCAPEKFPCPKCGRRGRRKSASTRTVRTVAHEVFAVLAIEYGEYAARRCRTTARIMPEGIPADAEHDDRVHGLVLDPCSRTGMSIERALASTKQVTGLVADAKLPYYQALHRSAVHRTPGSPPAARGATPNTSG